jgi:hypothetical protein
VLVAADFNGDGKLDLAVPNVGGASVSVLLGTGTGGFGAQTTFAVGSTPKAVVAADFNGDGKLDLATANLGDDTVSVLLGTGNGTFGAQTTVAVGSQPFSIRAADVNKDGHLDLVVANNGDDDVGVLLGHGDGTFCSQTTFPVGPGPKDAVIGDFNGDGLPDLAAPNYGGSGVSVLINQGAAANSAGIANLAAMLDGGVTYVHGQPAFVTSYDGGVKTTIMVGGKNDPLFTIVWPDANHVNVTGDQNQDGVIDYRYQGSFDGTNYSETEYQDHDFDGVLEAERTRTVVMDGGAYWLTETLYTLQGPDGGVLPVDAGGSYVATSSRAGPNYDMQTATGCELSPTPSCDVFPPGTGNTVPVPEFPNIHVIENGLDGGCAEQLGGRPLEEVLHDALGDLIGCLGSGTAENHFNAKAFGQLMEHLGNIDPNAPYDIACGLTCKGIIADTRIFTSWPLPANGGCVDLYGTNLNPGLFENGGLVSGDGTNTGQVMEAFGHELLHFSGFDHNPQPYGAPQGKDMIYACGRYCNLCQADLTGEIVKQSVPVNSPQSFHDDCYLCADDTPAHKAQCGSQAINFDAGGNGPLTCTDLNDPTATPFGCQGVDSYQITGCALNNPIVLPGGNQVCCADSDELSCCNASGACTAPGCADVQAGGFSPIQECAQYGTFACTAGVLN